MKIGDIVEAKVWAKPHYGLYLSYQDKFILCDVGDNQPDEIYDFQINQLIKVEILRINGDAISGRAQR